MKKALIIATDFPPYPSVGRRRTIKFLKHLRSFDWEPIVLAPSDTFMWGKDVSLLQEIPEGIKIYRAFYPNLLEILLCFIRRRKGSKTLQEVESDKSNEKPKPMVKRSFLRLTKFYSNFSKKYLFIPDNYIFWLPFAFLKGLNIIRREGIDIVYTTVPAYSLILLGRALKKHTEKEWVIDYRDLWSGDHTRMWLKDWRKKIEKNLERQSARQADAIVSTSQPKVFYLKQLLQTFNSDKFFCITNGFDPDDYPKPENQYRIPNRLTITYTGRLYKKMTAVQFLEALGQLATENPEIEKQISIQFIGDISDEEMQKIRLVIVHYNLSNMLKFIGYVPYTESMKYQVSADILLLIIGMAENCDGIIPTKLFEYMGSGRPIFAIVPKGAARDLIKTTGIGVFASPDNKMEIKNQFNHFIKVHQEKKEFKISVYSEFSVIELARNLSMIFNQLFDHSLNIN